MFDQADLVNLKEMISEYLVLKERELRLKSVYADLNANDSEVAVAEVTRHRQQVEITRLSNELKASQRAHGEAASRVMILESRIRLLEQEVQSRDERIDELMEILENHGL